MQPPSMWSTEQMRQVGQTVLEMLAEFTERSRQGADEVVRLEQVETLVSELGLNDLVTQRGAHIETVLEFVQRFINGSTRLQHPAYLAHQVALPHWAAAIADLVSGMLNNGMSVFEMGPTAGAVEIFIIDWMLAHVGWQPSGRNASNPPAPGTVAGGGVLTHGGSLANLTALLAARAAAAPAAWQSGTPENLVVLAPESSHYSLARATAILGLGTDALVEAPADRLGRMLAHQLPATITRLQSEGKKIMAVVANACATATGLYDPLDEISAVCRKHDIWLHVDGAHGASALVNPEQAHRMTGVSHADSLVWDAHKLLQTSALCAAVLVRQGPRLTQAFQQEAVYVTEGDREVGCDFIGQQFECTKAPLGLKLLLTMALVGQQGVSDNIGILWQRAREAAALIAEHPSFELLCPPESNILCFRHDGGDELQTAIRNDLMHRGDFLVSQAQVAGRRWLRLTLMNPLSDETVIRQLLDRIEASVQGAGGAW